MAVQPGLCWNWSEASKTGFVVTSSDTIDIIALPTTEDNNDIKIPYSINIFYFLMKSRPFIYVFLAILFLVNSSINAFLCVLDLNHKLLSSNNCWAPVTDVFIVGVIMTKRGQR